MKRIIHWSILMAAMTYFSGCGWYHNCTNSRSYKMGEVKSITVGSPIIQSGCFAAQYEPSGFNSILLHRPTSVDPYFEPTVDKELIYSGRAGNTLHITYREYTWQGLARSSFFQQLYYDLGSSKSFVFQDWVIDVIESNNQQITFKVIKEPVRKEPFYIVPAI